VWNYQAVWQLTEEPTIEPVVRAVLALLVIAISVYLTFRVFLALGLTSAKADRLLDDVGTALDKCDFSVLSRLVNALSRHSPEVGLARLASLADSRELTDVSKIFKEADFKFHAVTSQLGLYVEELHNLVWLTLIGSTLWLVTRLQGILAGISSQTHLNISIVAASLSEVASGTAELLAVLTAVYVLERLCAFRVSARSIRWKLFVSSRAVS
jgi:hypothetical protein